MKYYFFYWDIYSNWFLCDIIIDWIKFNCSEQYFMYKKAKIFWTQEDCDNILKEKDPMKQKQLWRNLVINENEWNLNKYWIMCRWVYEKFKQNEKLKNILIKEWEWIDLFVEASPTDRVWWIWYYACDALDNIDNWWMNLLGKIITDVRKNIILDI